MRSERRGRGASPVPKIPDSIVISGGYEDDEDYGDLIVYTGAGGRSVRRERDYGGKRVAV
ncbi:MAG: YDG/SRA domain-containing protein [Gaiellaceae bacterium]